VLNLRVQVSNLQSADEKSITFDITVNGQPAAEAKLIMTPGSPLPMQREQVVFFEGGEMRAKEIYEVIKVDDMIDAKEVPSKFRDD